MQVCSPVRVRVASNGREPVRCAEVTAVGSDGSLPEYSGGWRKSSLFHNIQILLYEIEIIVKKSSGPPKLTRLTNLMIS